MSYNDIIDYDTCIQRDAPHMSRSVVTWWLDKAVRGYQVGAPIMSTEDYNALVRRLNELLVTHHS
jgi:hypothetical protein